MPFSESLLASGESRVGIGSYRNVACNLAKRIRTLVFSRSTKKTLTPEGGGWGTAEMRATERIFVYLQILSACALALAHGADICRSNVPDVHPRVDVHGAHTIFTRI